MNNNILNFNVEGDQLQKLLSEVKKSEGVVFATLKNNLLSVELDEFANASEIVDLLLSIGEEFGVNISLIEGSSKQEDNEKKGSENEFSQPTEEESVSSKFFLPNTKYQTVQQRSKKLFGSLIERCVELTVAFVIVLVGVFSKPNSQDSFNWKLFACLVSFAISAYEIFFYAFDCLTKKKFFDVSLPISIFIILLAVNLRDVECAVFSLIFGIVIMLINYSEDKVKLLIEETVGDFDNGKEKNDQLVQKFEKTIDEGIKKRSKINLVISLICILLSFSPIFVNVEQFEKLNLLYVLSSAFVVIVGLSASLTAIYKKIMTVKALTFGIDFTNYQNAKNLGESNEFVIDSDVLTENDNLKDDTIGAIKELQFLGVKSIKTNFNCPLSENVKSQLEFSEYPLNVAKTVTVGKEGRDVNFSDKKSQAIDIMVDEMKYLPLAFRIAKQMLKGLNCIFVFLCLLLPVLSVSAIVFTFLGKMAIAKILLYLATTSIVFPSLKLCVDCFH